MSSREDRISIAVGGQRIAGTLVIPSPKLPGVLMVHGWGGNQDKYLSHAREIAALGCMCLTFDLRGHAETEQQRGSITPAQNMDDLVCAYEYLAGHPSVDAESIAVIG